MKELDLAQHLFDRYTRTMESKNGLSATGNMVFFGAEHAQNTAAENGKANGASPVHKK